MKRLFPVICLFSLLVAGHSFAGSATWNLNPTSGDWNTAANWIPATVPNGPADVATFDVSNTTNLSFSSYPVEVSSIVFNPGASSFNIAVGPASAATDLTLSGAGMINNSQVTQNLTLAFPNGLIHQTMSFLNAATAGDDIAYTIGDVVLFNDTTSAGSATFAVEGALAGGGTHGGTVDFYGNSTAANASFTVDGALASGGYGGQINFFFAGSAGDGVFVINSGSGTNRDAGEIQFSNDATAANGVFTLNGSTKQFAGAANILFYVGAPTAGNASFIVNGGVNGGQEPAVGGAYITFFNGSAGTATFINNGGIGANASGGYTDFNDGSTPNQARLVANGGQNGGIGGAIRFIYTGDGGTAQIEVYGNGQLDVGQSASPGLTTGSLAGDGLVYLASRNLTVGSNNLSTTFSGIIQENGGGGTGTNGSVTKIGTGTLTLSGASIYKGGTTVSAGTLLVKNTTGSATGTGAVQVSGGILGGKGIIAGATSIGTRGAVSGFLRPGKGATTATTLTIQNSLTFKSNGTYIWKLNTKKAKSDQVIASGVTVEAGAQFDFTTIGNTKLTAGKVFNAISNTAATPITGTFSNLANGSTVTVGVNKLQVSYSGGDGNDLTLTVVP